MKHILSFSLIAVLAIGFTACKKNSPSVVDKNSLGVSPITTTTTTTTADPLAPVGALPGSYTKKAVLEEFTGEWCGWCPEGAKVMEDLIAANPGKVIGISVHDGDPMEIPSFNAWIKGLTSVSGYPNGSVDRADATGRGSWAGQVATSLAKPAKLGLAMVNKKSGDKVDIKVFIGYPASISGAKLTVAVIENDVPQSPGGQSNYSSTVVVDGNWKHSHVLRGLVTANEGDDVSLNSAKNYTIVEFKGVDLSAMGINNMANVHIAAFVNLNDAPRDILNGQEAGLNETKKWD